MPPQRSPNYLASFKFASEGLWYVARTQRNFRFHLAATAAVVALAGWVGLSLLSWAILTLTIALVLVAEVVNTAAESLVDLASPDYHPLAKQVKDLAAGAVLLTAIAAVVVGGLILGPPLLAVLPTLFRG